MRTLTISVLLLALPAVACTHATLEAPNVPNPVLLGPVDRVGGHRAAPESGVGQVEMEVADFVAATSETKQVGNTEVTTQKRTAIFTRKGAVSLAVLEKTEGRPERDVRVEEIPLGAWAFITVGSAMAERWVGIRGRVVEVRHDR